ncbi:MULTISPECIES: YeeE/YedE thiosulfate transporter family protein [Sulfurimonas]|uniref:YeeE/YedE thiosulfate transporter family protein n=1 Tax=Sulfurimonas TaxID=202746 RepID=UPI0012657C1E|nr:YeeE/YedE thiosulfate transporter family protein [Sulfurimonas indica]
MSIGEYFDFVLTRTEAMYNIVQFEGHGSFWLVFVIGIFFGGIIQYTRVDKFEKIAGFAMGKDTIIPKMLFLAIGITSIALYFEIQMGYASYHPKPIILQGLIMGGIIFGVGMAIMGKCPGTGPISIAEGRIDVLVGAFGGILGGWLFTKYYDDFFKPLMGHDYGKSTLVSVGGDYATFFVFVFGIALILIAILIPKMELFDDADLSLLEHDERPDVKAEKEHEEFELVK